MWRGPYPNLWLTMRMVEFIWAPEMSNDTHLIFCLCAWKHYKQWIGNLIVCLTFVTEIFTLFVFPLSSTFKFLSCWINMIHGCSLKNHILHVHVCKSVHIPFHKIYSKWLPPQSNCLFLLQHCMFTFELHTFHHF